MARPLRPQAAGLTYHVMSRGNAKMSIYKDDEDREAFLSIMDRVAATRAMRVYTYCEMTTHYHLVCQTTRPNISESIRDLNGAYAQHFNRRYGRVGHVFQARFKAQVVDEREYAKELCRYVALNPVRAGVVSSPELWPWSAHRALAGLVSAPRFLVLDVLTKHFSADGITAARLRYLEFVAAPPRSKDTKAYSLFRGGTPIVGGVEFMTRFEETIHTAAPEVPRHERLLGRPPLEGLLTGSPARAELNARILNAHDQYGYTLEQIGALMGLSRTAVSMRLSDARKQSPITT